MRLKKTSFLILTFALGFGSPQRAAFAAESPSLVASCRFHFMEEATLSSIEVYQDRETNKFRAEYLLSGVDGVKKGTSMDLSVALASPDQVSEESEVWQSLAQIAGVDAGSLYRARAISIWPDDLDGNGADLFQLFGREGQLLGTVARMGWGFVPCE